jgi:hypothetical protein
MRFEQARSFRPLALLMMREAGAEGYALDGYEQAGASPFHLSAYGLEVPAGVQEAISVARLPLHVRNREVGCLAFVFRAAAIPNDTSRLLDASPACLNQSGPCLTLRSR